MRVYDNEKYRICRNGLKQIRDVERPATHIHFSAIKKAINAVKNVVQTFAYQIS